MNIEACRIGMAVAPKDPGPHEVLWRGVIVGLEVNLDMAADPGLVTVRMSLAGVRGGAQISVSPREIVEVK